MSTLAERLAAAAVGTRWADIPAEVVAKAKLCTLDQLGVVLAAWPEASTQALWAHVQEMGVGEPQATVIGSGRRASVAHATLLNAAMGHSLELEDHHSHSRSLNHPGVCSIPPALAMGEWRRAAGRDVLRAIVLGYEVGSRLSRAIPYPGFFNFERGFHETSVLGPFSAATVTAALDGLDAGRLAHAFGLAGSLAAGSTEFKANGAFSKRLQVGAAAERGVLAARLAARGFTGPLTVFEGKHGFFNAYALEGNYDLGPVLARWGIDWELPHIQFKPFGCAGVLHSAVTAASLAYERCRPAPEAIAGVTVHTSRKLIEEYAEPLAARRRPRHSVEAQFSLPYSVAVMLVTGRALVEEFTPRWFEDPAVLGVAAKVDVAVDPEIDRDWPKKDPTRLTLRLVDGRVVEVRTEQAKGEAAMPVTEAEVLEKFRRLVEPALGREAAQRAVDLVLRLETLADLSDLMALFRGAAR
ncbi:MAG TPA: MmgE/PrpD family protein [Thermodesulfobacteriota bacterium]